MGPTSVTKNSDHAATPENYLQFVIGGARGGGGGNYTDGTAEAATEQPPMPARADQNEPRHGFLRVDHRRYERRRDRLSLAKRQHLSTDESIGDTSGIR
jgi:hypothetical protein